jgi:NAD(P)-dependent dehydrogenase (short-subunit alcohol dehydrogenase family)
MKSPDLFRLDGEVAVIAGAGSDFGAVLAKGLAEAGADIAAADLDVQGANRAADVVEGVGRRSY